MKKWYSSIQLFQKKLHVTWITCAAFSVLISAWFNLYAGISQVETFSDKIILKIDKKNTIENNQQIVFILSSSDEISAWINSNKGSRLQLSKYFTDTPIGDDSVSYGEKIQSSFKISVIAKVGRAGSRNLFRILLGPVQQQFSFNQYNLEISGENPEYIYDPETIDKLLQNVSNSRHYVNTENIESGQITKDEKLNFGFYKKRIKIFISKEGIYQIYGKDLEKCGWKLNTINPKFLRIFNLGKEQPVEVTGSNDNKFDRDDKIIFFGQTLIEKDIKNPRPLTLYANENIYILELSDSPGLRYAQEEGWPHRNIAEPFSYPNTSKFYNNNNIAYLRHANFAKPEDHYVYSSLINGGEKWESSIRLPDPDIWSTTYLKFRIAIRGDAVDQNKMYPADVYLNNHLLVSGEWNGSNLAIMESFDFSPAFLNPEGENSLTVINRSSDGELAPMYADWFEVTYPRLFKSENNYLRFRAPQNDHSSVCRLTIENFTSPDIVVFKKGLSKMVGCYVKSVIDTLDNKTFSVTFEDSLILPDNEYLAAAEKSLLSPDSIQTIKPPLSLMANNRSENIIIVSVDSFLTDVDRLVKHRKESGITSSVIMLNDIYNEFGSGVPGPEPIRSFLKWAYNIWSTKPKTVLLVGNGTFFGRTSMAKGNLIPVPLYHSIKYGSCAADYFYSLLQGNDDLPEIGVGRFPVSNIKELSVVVDKTIEYGDAPENKWENKYCIVAAAGHGNVFLDQSEEFIKNDITPDLSPLRVYLSPAKRKSYLGTTEDLISIIDNGVSYINFRGHGGGAIWADGGLLTLEDVPTLSNKGMYPFITSMTCFTADFSSNRTCLGESMVLSKDRGAVAFFGATGVGWIWNDYFLITEFYGVIRKNPNLTIGEIIKETKRNLLSVYGGSIAVSDAYQYTLLGDPCIKLAMPYNAADAKIENRAVTDSVKILSNGKGDQSTVNVEITGDDFASVQDYDYTFSNENWELTIPLPDSLKAESDIGGVRIWQKHGSKNSSEHKFIPFAISSSYFDSLETLPAEIKPLAKFRISILLDSQEHFDSLWCKIYTPSVDSSLMLIENGNRFITQKEFGPYAANSSVNLEFYYLIDNGKKIGSKRFLLKVQGNSDLSIQRAGFTGADEVHLFAVIVNNGGCSADSVVVKFSCPKLSFVDFDTISVSQGELVESKVKFSPVVGTLDVRIKVDPDSAIAETNKTNNSGDYSFLSSLFNVTKNFGTLSGEKTDTVGVNDMGFCFIPAGRVMENGCLKISREINELYPDVKSVNFSFTKDTKCFGTVVFQRDSSALNAKNSIYRWDANSKQWIVCDSKIKNNSIIASDVPLPCSFSVMEKTDNSPPALEIQVEGQPFASGSYVSKNPSISILIEDSSGVNIAKGKVEIFLDDLPVNESKIIIPDSVENPKNFSILFRPNLNTGEHNLVVITEDVNGNSTKTEPVILSVASKFEIRFLGNHPNPFSPYKEKTIFAYTLTSPADKTVLKIYTVSGRLVSKFENPLMCGADYHEIEWDGSDLWEEKLANGVYFFSLEAESGSNRDVVRGKIAIIQ